MGCNKQKKEIIKELELKLNESNSAYEKKLKDCEETENALEELKKVNKQTPKNEVAETET